MFLAFDTLSTFVRVDDDSGGVRKTKKFQAVCFSILFSALYIDQHGIRRIESCFQRTVKTPKEKPCVTYQTDSSLRVCTNSTTGTSSTHYFYLFFILRTLLRVIATRTAAVGEIGEVTSACRSTIT